MIADVGDVDYVVGRRRILESVHPLLNIVGLAARVDRVDAESHIGQAAQGTTNDRYEPS